MTYEEYKKLIESLEIQEESTVDLLLDLGSESNNREKITKFIIDNNITTCKNMYDDMEHYKNYEKLVLFQTELY